MFQWRCFSGGVSVVAMFQWWRCFSSGVDIYNKINANAHYNNAHQGEEVLVGCAHWEKQDGLAPTAQASIAAVWQSRLMRLLTCGCGYGCGYGYGYGYGWNIDE